MIASESKTQPHTSVAWRLLGEADHALMTQDLPLTSEKLWQAALYAVKTLCANRGWECAGDDHVQLLNPVKRLAAERDDETIKLAFLIAGHCRANAKYDWMEFDELDENRARIRQLVEKILADVE